MGRLGRDCAAGAERFDETRFDPPPPTQTAMKNRVLSVVEGFLAAGFDVICVFESKTSYKTDFEGRDVPVHNNANESNESIAGALRRVKSCDGRRPTVHWAVGIPAEEECCGAVARRDADAAGPRVRLLQSPQ